LSLPFSQSTAQCWNGGTGGLRHRFDLELKGTGFRRSGLFPFFVWSSKAESTQRGGQNGGHFTKDRF
jgi:hypothetical protein